MPDNPYAEFGPSQNPYAEFGPRRGQQPPAQTADPVEKPEVTANRQWSDIPGEAARNLPGSALKFGENLVQPFIHPIDTYDNLKNLTLGITEYVTGEKDGSHKKYADAVGQMISERYGSIQNLKKTLATDPVGVLADFSSIATGGGALLRGAGTVARVAGAARTGERLGAAGRTLSDVGSEVEPLRVARHLGTIAKETVIPNRGRRAAVNELERAGNLMTPGQRLGGPAKYLEDKAAALPFLKDVVQHGRDMSIESFNQVIGNRALAPIGKRLTDGVEAGHNMVADVHRKIDAAYDALLPRLTFAPDGRLATRVRQIFNNRVRNLPDATQAQFRNIVTNYVRNRSYPMPGQHYKILESELGKLATDYMRSPIPDTRLLGEALNRVHEAARATLVRQNPRYAPQLQQINTAYAMYKRIEDAAGRRAGSEGLFTTMDMLQASKNASTRGPWARGDAIFQRFAEAAHKILPKKEPESGTPGGHAVGHMISGAAGGLAAGGAAALAAGIPAAAKAAMFAVPPAAAIGSLYTRPGMHAVNWLARNRRDVIGARNLATQAGRLPDDQEVKRRQPLKFTVPGHGPDWPPPALDPLRPGGG